VGDILVVAVVVLAVLLVAIGSFVVLRWGRQGCMLKRSCDRIWCLRERVGYSAYCRKHTDEILEGRDG
jgi:hypothetical protein